MSAASDLAALREREPTLSTDRLADGVWTVGDGNYRTIFAEGRTGVVAVNTFGSPGAARAYGAAIEREVPGKAIGAVVCTIDHLDHAGYAGVLAPDAEIIAHELTARTIDARTAPHQMRVTRQLIGDGEAFELDGVSLRARYPGPTMGSGNIALEIVGSGVLFVVGPRADARYGLFPDVHFRNYARSLRAMLDADVATVVPGRSRAMTHAEAIRAVEYVEALQEACQRAFAEGVPIWEYEPMRAAVGDRLRAAFGDLDGFERQIGIAAIRVVHFYLTGGWQLEDTAAPEVLLRR